VHISDYTMELTVLRIADFHRVRWQI